VSALFQEQLKLRTAIKKQKSARLSNIYTRCIIILILNTSMKCKWGVLSHNNSKRDENANRQQTGNILSKAEVQDRRTCTQV
jgi:hypothetical protein